MLALEAAYNAAHKERDNTGGSKLAVTSAT